ncbi:hypothetical protein A4H97_10620 [Niastella yeongjuensis]|uniref:DUF4230 domain-containing protein n=1 Tax=Niastella yeongjuensis TaxID=354355 RepID=A0A1V9EF79_9BACT|nr:DUF4230 domain-containing protein [Niastella yeongjuensis]OQP44807.1 hypothetical protein A4H97_10620 [Niastella yeongjuensis]
MKKLIIWLVLVLTIVLVFWLGQRFGARVVSERTLSNSLIVREIAELASLEVQGTASIKRSNLTNDGGWEDNFRKMFAENTIWVTVPYTAKFGVNVNENNFKVAVGEKEVVVTLPPTQLLSYELRLDQMETANKKGWFMFSDDETYTDVQKKLYTTSRQQIEQNKDYREQSKVKIYKIISQYYAPFNLVVKVKFGDEAPQTLPLN